MWDRIARNGLFLVVALFGLAAVAANLFPAGEPERVHHINQQQLSDVLETAAEVDTAFRQQWSENTPPLIPARQADALTVARRMYLALAGTIPSLEEIREFESSPAVHSEHPAQWWLASILDNTGDDGDRRFAEYFAERLARAYVGTEDGPFLLYRRRRFVTWLADELHVPHPRYDQIVRKMLASEGLWTDKPAVNFLTRTIKPNDGDENDPDPEELASRVSRAFLGMRLDCARCHDHKFEDWTQQQFHGLAAFFGQADMRFTGVREDAERTYSFEVATTGEQQQVAPGVPFDQELWNPEGSLRQQLANWVTHPKNEFFARATVNRVWALLFGRAMIEPVDDMTTVVGVDGTWPAPLEILARDFVAHDYDLKRLIKVIVSTQIFQAESALGSLEADDFESISAWLASDLTVPPPADSDESIDTQRLAAHLESACASGKLDPIALFKPVEDAKFESLVARLNPAARAALAELSSTEQRAHLAAWIEHETGQSYEDTWAVFPLSRLRPEQVSGAILQSAKIQTVDHESHILIRLARAQATNEFVRRFGDAGDDELSRRGGTIPQRLLMMNGNLVKEQTKQELMTAAGLVADISQDNHAAIDGAYLCVLSRHPTPEEVAYFERQFTSPDAAPKSQRVEDLFWTLINSTEFSWNH